MIFKAAQGKRQEKNSSDPKEELEQSNWEASPQVEEGKEEGKSQEPEPVTTDYLIGDTDLEQLFDSSSNKAKGARHAKKRKLSKEEQTLIWAEMKQKLKILRKKNKK